MKKLKLERITRSLYDEPLAMEPAAILRIQGAFERYMDGRYPSKLSLGDVGLFDDSHKETAKDIARLRGDVMEDDEEDKPAVEAAARLEAEQQYRVIRFEGAMIRRAGFMAELCADVCGTERRAAMIYDAMEAPHVHTINLIWDSPGGQISGQAALVTAIREASAMPNKNVISWVTGDAASAAYWGASQAQIIVASPTSRVASMGVYLAMIDDSKKMEKEGLSWVIFRGGEHKAPGIGRALTNYDIERYQAMVNESLAMMRADISTARPGIKPEDMEGQVFTANEGLSRGMVDVIAMNPEQLMNQCMEDPEKLKRLFEEVT